MQTDRLHDRRYERSDPEAIRRLQLSKLIPLLRQTWAGNPFYQDLWRRAGAEPGRIDSLANFAAQIPFVRKRDFVADQAAAPPFGLRAAPALSSRLPLIVYNTNGTSGQGVEVHIQTRAEAEAVNEGYRYLYRWAGLEPGDHVFVCYPVSLNSGGQMDVSTLQSYGCTVYPVGGYDARQKLVLIERFKPRAIVGTPSYLMHLAAVSAGGRPSTGVEILLCSGETGSISQFGRLEALWHARVVSVYGATQIRADPMATCERPLLSGERRAMLHNLDPFYLLEVVDPATGRHVREGEAGEIVLTSLIHGAVPLVRCATGDRAVYRKAGSCGCGRPFCGVEFGTIGRIDEMKRIKGVTVWPQAVENLLFDLSEIDDYRIVLTRDAFEADVATAVLVPSKALRAEHTEILRTRVGRLLKDRIGIRFEVEVATSRPEAMPGQKVQRWVDERT